MSPVYISLSTFVSFPLFHSLPSHSLSVLSPGHAENRATAQCNTRLFRESKCHSTNVTFKSVLPQGGWWAISILCHPPTQMHIHTLYLASSDLASGIPRCLSSGVRFNPKCHSYPVTIVGRVNIGCPSSPLLLNSS